MTTQLVCHMLLVVGAGGANLPNVPVTGSITYLIDQDSGKPLAPDDVQYQPWPMAKVEAFRRQRLERVRTDNDGVFKFSTLTKGRPITLFFDGGEDLVPELEQLAADPDRPQIIHVTLLNPKQYSEIYGREALDQHLRRIIAILGKMEDYDVNALKKRFQKWDFNIR